MDRDRVPGTAGQSYERTYRSPISILISWRCFHKGALLLLLLSHPSSPLPLSSLCRILPWYNTMNLEACITLSRLFALAGISNQIILKSAPRNRGDPWSCFAKKMRGLHVKSKIFKCSRICNLISFCFCHSICWKFNLSQYSLGEKIILKENLLPSRIFYTFLFGLV